MWQLMQAMESSWGVRSSIFVWIYEAILNPRLTYATVAYASRVEEKTAEVGLKKLRGLLLRRETEMARSVLTAEGSLGHRILTKQHTCASCQSLLSDKDCAHSYRVKLVKESGPCEIKSEEILRTVAKIGIPTESNCLAMVTSGTWIEPRENNWQKWRCTGKKRQVNYRPPGPVR